MKINQQNLDDFKSHLHEFCHLSSKQVKERFLKCFDFDNERLKSIVENEIVCIDGGAFIISKEDSKEKFAFQDQLEKMLELDELGFICGDDLISVKEAQKIFSNKDVIEFLKEKKLID